MRIPQSSSLMSSRINLRSSSRFTADTSSIKKTNRSTDKIDLMSVARNTNADTKITNVDKENQVEQLPMYDPEYTAPVSMSECLAMFLFIILLFIGCAYLILR